MTTFTEKLVTKNRLIELPIETSKIIVSKKLQSLQKYVSTILRTGAKANSKMSKLML